MKTKVNIKVKKAFTLIELLVVIAIIALLVSILLPTLSKARELGRSAVCMTNLRALGTLFAMYANENGDRLPNGYYTATWYPMWNQVLGNSGNQSLMFGRDYNACPSDKEPVNPPPNNLSYAVHFDYDWPPVAPFRPYGQDGGIWRGGSTKVTDIALQAFMATDGIWAFFYNPDQFPFIQDTDSDGILDTSGAGYCGGGKPRHDNGMNMLYADGSVNHLILAKFLDMDNPGWFPQR